MKLVFFAALMAFTVSAADEKKLDLPKEQAAPVITADEKLVVKDAEVAIYRIRLDIQAAKDHEQELMQAYSKLLMQLSSKCREKGNELTEKLDCGPAKVAAVPAK